MNVLLASVVFVQFVATTNCLIVPDELPSLLSVIYSNIPTIKKGTDSRIGWGFRLGNRADFQVLVELGPQTNTQPLANQGTGAGGTSSKRNVGMSLRDILYAQRLRDKKKQISNTDGGKWIDQWSDSIRNMQKEQSDKLPLEPRPGLGVGEIDAKSVIPDDSVSALEQLYRKKTDNTEQGSRVVSVTTQKPKTTTSARDALDNVDLDDN